MFVIIAPIQIKEGFRDRFVDAMIEDAKGSLTNEPGCLRFDIIQDGEEPNRIWVYEVYTDKAAFDHHLGTPHLNKWRDTVKDWRVDCPVKGPPRGSSILWPPAAAWSK